MPRKLGFRYRVEALNESLESQTFMFRRFFVRLGQSETPPPWSLSTGLINLLAAIAALLLGSNLTLTVYCSAPANAPFCQALNFAVPPSVWFLGWTLGAGAIVAFIWVTRRTPAERAALRLGGLDMSIFWVLLVSIGLAVTLDLIVIQFTNGAIEPELQSLRQQPPDTITWILAFLFMALAQPVAEELVFRGILQPALRHNLGGWPGYIAASLAYAAFHLLAYTPATASSETLTYSLVLALIGGLIFGAVRILTNSTRAAILAHMAFGVFAVLKVLTLG